MHVLISQDPGWQGEERAMLRPPTRVAAEEARGEKEQLAGQWRSKRGGQRQYHVLGLPPSKGFVFCTEPGPRSTVSSQHVTLTSRVCLLALGLTLHILRVRQILLRCAASEMRIPPHTHTHILASLKLDCVSQSLASYHHGWPDGSHDAVVTAWQSRSWPELFISLSVLYLKSP